MAQRKKHPLKWKIFLIVKLFAIWLMTTLVLLTTEAAKQAGLYTIDASFTLFPRGENGPAAFTLTSRDQLMGSFEKLKPFKAVTHFNAQNFVDFETPEQATGEVY